MKPFTDLAPDDMLGGSAMLVYHGAFDMRVPAGISEVMLARISAMDGQRERAIEHARRAVELIPDAAVSHVELCKAFFAEGDRESAIPACTIARVKIHEDPVCTRCEQDKVEQALSWAAGGSQPVGQGAAPSIGRNARKVLSHESEL
jgi:hypothetical protein